MQRTDQRSLFGQPGRLAARLIALSFLAATTSPAVIYNWNVAVDGGNWTDLRWNGGVAGPTAPGDSAVIDNKVPSNWTGNMQTIVVNTALNIDRIDVRDTDPAISNQSIRLQFNNNSAVTTLAYVNDSGGSGRSDLYISPGVTLTVNKLDITGRFVNGVYGGGTIAFAPIGGAVTYGYYDGHEQYGGNTAWDFTAATTVNLLKNGDQGDSEGRDVNWLVGNATGNQTWVIKNSNGTLVGSPHPFIRREVGGGFNFIKPGGFDLDMGASAGTSDGIWVQRFTTGNFQALEVHSRLFTDAAGNAVGGNARIGAYTFREVGSAGDVRLATDVLGTNLAITTGGFNLVSNADGPGVQNDINVFQVLSGRTLKAEGATTGDIVVNDSNANTANRMGIYFAGGTLWAERNLNVLGPQTFLNDGGTASNLRAGGNVTVQSQSASGYTGTLAGSIPATLPSNSTVDNFDLRATTLRMDGGGSKTLTWATGAALGTPGSMVAGDFGLNNFTVDSLYITNNTSVLFAYGSALYLDNDLTIDLGSKLINPGPLSYIHIGNTAPALLSKLQGYILDGRLADWTIVTSPSGAFTLIPEPASLALLGLGALVLLRRQRKP